MRINILLKDNKIRFTLLIVINTAIFIFCANFFPVRFQTNDDVIMAWIANGVVTGTPDCHLVFMNAIYGCFLTFLYGIAPNIEWYSVCFSVFHVVSISIIIAFFYRKIQNKLVRWVVICLYYLLWFRIIQFFQFTTTTAMLAFSGILLLLNGKYIFGGGILLISSLLRFEAAGLVGLLSVPIFLYYYHLDVKKYASIFGILFIITGFHIADGLFYNTEQWREYREYNHYRGVVNDSPNNWILNQAELPQNVSRENIQLLRNCNADPCQISNEDMKKLGKIVLTTPFINKCKNLPYCILHYPYCFISAVVFILMFVTYLLCPIKNGKFALVCAFVLLGCILGYISLDWQIKRRIIDIFCFVLFSYVLFIPDNLCFKTSVVVSMPFFMAILVLLCYLFLDKKRVDDVNIDEQMNLITKAEVRVFDFNHKFHSTQLSPWGLKKIHPKKIIYGGWLTKSPFVPIKSFRETVDSNIGFFVSKNDSLTSFRNALRSNYGIETEMQTLVESEHYAVVSLKSKPTAERKN